MTRDFRKLYDCLLESDELYVMFKGMKGEWEIDSKKFIQSQLDLEKMVNATITEEYEQE